MRGCALTQLRRLCFANVGEAPQPWLDLHRLLLRALLAADWGGAAGVEGGWLRRTFSPAWFCDAMARLHINSFR